MPLPMNALAVLEEPESKLVTATGAPADKITTVSLVDKWTRRITRMRVESRDALNVRVLSLYAGDAANTIRTLLTTIQLTNYQTKTFNTEELNQMIKKFVADGTTNVDLYGIISGGTDGILVDVSYIDETLS